MVPRAERWCVDEACVCAHVCSRRRTCACSACVHAPHVHPQYPCACDALQAPESTAVLRGRGAPSASPGEGGRALQDARITSVPPDFPPSLEWDARSGRGPAGTAHLCRETDAPVAAGPGERLDCTVRGPRSRWRRGGRDARLSRGPGPGRAACWRRGAVCARQAPRSPQSWPQCGEPGQAGRGGGGRERVPAGSPRPRPRTGHRPSHLSPARLPPFCPHPPARPCPCSCLSTKPRAGPVPAGSPGEGGLWGRSGQLQDAPLCPGRVSRKRALGRGELNGPRQRGSESQQIGTGGPRPQANAAGPARPAGRLSRGRRPNLEARVAWDLYGS